MSLRSGRWTFIESRHCPVRVVLLRMAPTSTSVRLAAQASGSRCSQAAASFELGRLASYQLQQVDQLLVQLPSAATPAAPLPVSTRGFNRCRLRTFIGSPLIAFSLLLGPSSRLGPRRPSRFAAIGEVSATTLPKSRDTIVRIASSDNAAVRPSEQRPFELLV